MDMAVVASYSFQLFGGHCASSIYTEAVGKPYCDMAAGVFIEENFFEYAITLVNGGVDAYKRDFSKPFCSRIIGDV